MYTFPFALATKSLWVSEEKATPWGFGTPVMVCSTMPPKTLITSTVLLPSAETNTRPWPKAKWSKRPFTPSRGTEPDKTSGLLLPEAVLFCASVEPTLAGGFFCAVCSAPHEVVTEKIAKVAKVAAAENLIIILLLSCCFRLLIGISRPTQANRRNLIHQVCRLRD